MSTVQEGSNFWQGEAEARIKGAEARLNAINGDLKEIRSHMGGTRGDLLLLQQRVNSLDTNVTGMLRNAEYDRNHQIELLEKAIEQARVKTRNLLFWLVVPIVAALVSGLVPYLILGGPVK